MHTAYSVIAYCLILLSIIGCSDVGQDETINADLDSQQYYCFYTAEPKRDWRDSNVSNKSIKIQQELWGQYENGVLLLPPLYEDGIFYLAQGCDETLVQAFIPSDAYELRRVPHEEFRTALMHSTGN